MNIMRHFNVIFFSVISVCFLSACGGTKLATDKSRVEMQQDKCEELAKKKPEIRASGEGTSFNVSTASNYAELQARAKFARAVAAAIDAAEGNEGFDYRKSSTDMTQGSSVRDEGARRNENQLSIANEVIRNTVIIESTQYMLKDGSYQVYVCLEYREGVSKLAEDVTEKVKQRVSDDDRIKMQYEFEKFKERVENEMKKRKGDD